MELKYIERLKKCRDAVKATPARNFDMGTWKCKTRCCAIGAFCTLNPRADLRLNAHSFYAPYLKSSGRVGTKALEIFFGIGGHDVDRLFMPSYSGAPGAKDKKNFLDEMNAFIKEKEAEAA